MKFTQTGTFKRNTLTELITVEPKERFQNIMLEKLDYFVGFLAKEKSIIITDYVKNLTKKYRGFVEEDNLGNSTEEIKKISAKFKNVTIAPDLVEASLNYFIHLLQLKEKSEWGMNKVEITMKALVQAWIYPSNYFLETLAETIDRKEAEAMKYYKK